MKIVSKEKIESFVKENHRFFRAYTILSGVCFFGAGFLSILGSYFYTTLYLYIASILIGIYAVIFNIERRYWCLRLFNLEDNENGRRRK